MRKRSPATFSKANLTAGLRKGVLDLHCLFCSRWHTKSKSSDSSVGAWVFAKPALLSGLYRRSFEPANADNFKPTYETGLLDRPVNLDSEYDMYVFGCASKGSKSGTLLFVRSAAFYFLQDRHGRRAAQGQSQRHCQRLTRSFSIAFHLFLCVLLRPAT